jgi:FAD/FMN-containing dehydrogenase
VAAFASPADEPGPTGPHRPARTDEMGETIVTDLRASTAELELPGFRGTLFRPGDSGYDEARRVFNGMIDRTPGVIARCADAADVVLAVNAARERGAELSVYGGGHGVTGAAVCDGGICIDLRGLKGVDVDPRGRTVRAEGGLLWGELDAATQEHGLAVTGGRVTDTGIAGLALGSGSGWLERKLGFTCDNLIEAEVVTADGRRVTASESENPDLFWALRGGGGNFGIVTAFRFRLHPIGPIVLGGMLAYPAAMATDVARFWRDFMLDAPDEVGGGMAFITAPPADFVPEPVRGHPIVAVVLCYAGPVEEGEEVLRPLREFGPPGLDLVQPMPYVAVQQLLDDANIKGTRNYWTADFYTGLPDEAIDVLVGHATKPVSPLSQMIVVPGGGAIARVSDEATAFGQRTAQFNIHYLSMWVDPADDERNIEYTRATNGAMKPWSTGGVYLNFIGDEGADRIQAAFGAEKYAKLRAIKKIWDPTNLFHHNQNIRPA